MHDYQRTKNNPYYLPTALYRRMLWLVRDYDRLQDELDNMLHESPSCDGMPRGTDVGNPVESKAIRREKLLRQTEAVEQALRAIPSEYRQGVYEHVVEGVEFPSCADRKTWYAWQARFIYRLAERLGEI